ncbi:hypothetical protein PanWU01x14_226180 [Parasponia andersonii]|uniref:DUF241 domain protein n=1 Tax=Parasponia andersonii TaxID=3476 RepID=A0A2P5BMF2_PARAD|nr:hypothetical protein PanWU01x14_226180 [Parasponia andersonii]
MANRYHVRSISFPSRSHPSTVRVEEQLNKLKTWEAASNTSASVLKGLSGLEELYECVDDLLNMGSTQQVLSKNQLEKCLEDLLDGSLRLLDICGITRDVLLQTNEHVGALQSALRRRKEDSTMETSITGYICFRKKMKKEVTKLTTALKQVDKKFEASLASVEKDHDRDHHLYAVMRVLTQVCAMNSSVFQSLLVFLTAPSSPKSRRWSLVSKLVHKGAIACEEKQDRVNELDSVDAALSTLCSDADKIQTAHKRLEALEISIDGLENGLESMFRRLIKTRTSFLNIISQ